MSLDLKVIELGLETTEQGKAFHKGITLIKKEDIWAWV